jgi:hypothetical protein
MVPLFALVWWSVIGSHDDGVMGNRDRRSYPTDVANEEWIFVAAYLTMCKENASQRDIYCGK